MASTRKNSLSRIRSFFAYLERSGVILRNPARDLPLPKVSSLPRVVLTVGQAGQLMRAPGGLLGLRDRAILEVLYGSGLRRSECARIEMTDLDLAEGTLLVRDGKGGRDRYVPMTGSAMRAVDEYLRRVRDLLTKDAREQGLFLSRLRKRLTACGLDRVVKRHGRAVGVSLSPHALRHACATHLLKGGASIRHVQAILGHKNLNTTAVYTRVLAEDLKQVVRRSHPREREVE